MKAYFDELDPNYNVSFIDEINPLGTAGSLRFLKGKFDKPFFVTNCDIVVKTDYISLMKTHLENNNDITLVASTKEYIIPYGTCETKMLVNFRILMKSQNMISRLILDFIF